MAGQQGDVAWRDGNVPVSLQFDDPYFSLENGLAEARHVFLAGNSLPKRFRPGFHVAELGFGTGLNLLACLQTWRGAGIAGPLRFTSFEAFPLDQEQMARALSDFTELAPIAGDLLEAWPGKNGRIELADLHFELVAGDARQTLPAWGGLADAWFLDGFAPARNPELWEGPLMAEVARHTASGGTFATYTAAGRVRQSLAAAGFEVERTDGFGRKRHMSRGRLPGGHAP